MRIHELKTWPKYYQEVEDGTKRFELRIDDRGFEVGDVLHLREYDPVSQQYSGRFLYVEVTYLLTLNDFIPAVNSQGQRWVVLSIEVLPAQPMTTKEFERWLVVNATGRDLVGAEPVNLRAEDYPLHTGKPGPGWRLDIPLADGRTLFLEIGKVGRDALLEMFAQDAADEAAKGGA